MMIYLLSHAKINMVGPLPMFGMKPDLDFEDSLVSILARPCVAVPPG